MTTTEINILLAVRKKSVQSVADAIGERKDRVSATINYLRKNQRVREKIAVHLGMPIEELFGDQQEAPGVNAPVHDAPDTSTHV